MATKRRVPGLRERKKAKTRATIQRHALRLFGEQGYAETTIEQIAEAAEVSPSTLFRYFPTKEDLVLYDALDPEALEVFRAEPAGLSPLEALRDTLRTLFGRLASEEMTQQQERLRLTRLVPEVRAKFLEHLTDDLQMLSQAVAERAGRSANDFAVRVFAGAVVGVALSVLVAAIEDSSTDFVELFDAALAQLEAGLSL